MLEFWGMPLLQGSLWSGMVSPDTVPSMDQIKLFHI